MWPKTIPAHQVAITINNDSVNCITVNHAKKPTVSSFQTYLIPDYYTIDHASLAQSWLINTITHYYTNHAASNSPLSITIGGQDITQLCIVSDSHNLPEQTNSFKGMQYDHAIIPCSTGYIHTINAIPHHIVCKYKLLVASLELPVLFFGTQLQAALQLACVNKRLHAVANQQSISDICSHIPLEQLQHQFNYQLATDSCPNAFKLAIGTYYLGV